MHSLANNAESNGWNLVGNPYACAIQWDEEGADKWTMEKISSVISIRDNGSGGGTFKYWDMDENYSEIPGGQIATGQSFWVRATEANPKLIIREGVKVIGSATFFRKQQKHIPSFALSLSKDSLTDVAYFKIRPSATAELDKWDGVKLDNDNFDLSFFSVDNKSLAIHAQDRMPCEEIIRVELKDLKPGTYKLSLITKYEFANYSYRLIDNFLKTETVITSDRPLNLVVTQDNASYAVDRISLFVKEAPLKTDLQVVGPPVACSDEVVKISIKGAQLGVTYSAWIGAKQLGEEIYSTGDDFEIEFSADSLSPGQHTIAIKAETACQMGLLSSTVSLVKDRSPEIYATSDIACTGNSISLTASSDRSDAVFTWFSDANSTDTIASSSHCEITSLMKPQHYYVSASVPSGCISARLPVRAEIIVFDSAKISLIDNTTLASNYATNNSWYLNGQKLEDAIGQYVNLSLAGIYTLKTDTLGCVSSDSLTYVLTQSEDVLGDEDFYPNPVSQFLFVRDPYDRIKRIEVFNSLGALMIKHDLELLKNTEAKSLDIHHLPNGIYLVILAEPLRKRVFRFIKN